MAMEKFDVCVIGAGPGGYVAAIKAGQKGLKTALIEKGNLGGTCLNIGCIPTKTLIASAEVLHSARHAADFGVEISGEIKPNWTKMLQRKEDVLGKLRGGIAGLLKAAGVTVFNGTASFMNRQSVMVAGGENAGMVVQAKNFIIAAGSTSLVPGFIPQGPRVITSTELLSIPKVPKSLLVLGGGVIGCEFACLFAEMGTEVTVVEMLPSILPPVDREVAKTLSKIMESKGIKIMTGAPLGNIKATAKGVTGEVGDAKVSAEYLLVSIGRKSVASELNLGAAGVQTNERGWIPVNEYAQSNIPNIYAIGDITGKGMLAHWASAQAAAAVETIAGKRTALAADQIPGAIFTTPEIGSLGATEEQLKEQGVAYKVGKFPFAALGKAMAINETDGFVKILADANSDAVLGVHIIGPHATDLIAEAAPVMKMECTARELGSAIHAHPTIGEAVMEAAHAVHGESAHIPSRRR
ncbi:MAG: dihydrolipoyl dehydrogenase [Lentisphaerae bacterium]|nr:dihydrolipoyl dehydrogenase [Lentisphaerota bacterium]